MSLANQQIGKALVPFNIQDNVGEKCSVATPVADVAPALIVSAIELPLTVVKSSKVLSTSGVLLVILLGRAADKSVLLIQFITCWD